MGRTARRRAGTRRAACSIAALLLVVMTMMMAAGCGEQEETTTKTTTAEPAGTETTAREATETSASETATSAAGTPVSGGVLRLIHTTTPQVLGYWPKQGPMDELTIYPAVERIVTHAPGRTLEPYLAESAVEDPDALTITVKLREGVLFHDGSELTAEVAKWNYDGGIASGKLQQADALKEFEIVDKYTYVLHLNYWNNQLYENLTYVPMFSKDAYDKNGEEWVMTHLVATGPFMLGEFNRDQSVKWVRNPNYWRGEPYPYLDGVEHIVITDATTASAMMQAGEADIWQVPDAQSQAEMIEKGFKVQTGSATVNFHLIPNTMTDSPMNDQRVREAAEYALDKPAINDAIGYGRTFPLYQVAPDDEPGVRPPKIKREYDPEKAKQLLVEAGYPDGCPIDILAEAQTGGRNTAAEAVKGYLDAAGFITNIDVADAGRFYGSIYGTGWKDLVLWLSGSGNGPTYLLDCVATWGPTPKSRLASYNPPEELLALFEPALQARTLEEQKEKTADIVAYITEHALVIPLYANPMGILVQDWVHTDYPMEGGSLWWSFYDDWMDPH